MIATVKGDVHDIGKNIVGVVLQCNNFEVIDLGVMVPCEKILETARREEADIIGLSGLITPSLDEMVHVAREMQRQGFELPLLIGGATTSPGAYLGEDRSAVQVAGGLREGCLALGGRVSDAGQRRRQRDGVHREDQRGASSAGASSMPARRSRRRSSTSRRRAREPAAHRLGGVRAARAARARACAAFEDYPLSELLGYIDWMPFFNAWEFAGKFPGRSSPIPSSARRRAICTPMRADAEAADRASAG